MTRREMPLHGSGDDELDALFSADPGLIDTARALRNAAPNPAIDDQFRRQLRAQIIAEAQVRYAPKQRNWLQRRAGTLPALFAGGAGVALVAATIFIVVANPSQNSHAPSWTTPAVADVPNADTAQAIRVDFNQPMDQQAVVAGLHIQPAAAVTTSWSGNSLLIQPVHPLAANTAYTVTIDQSAILTSSGQAAPAALSFSFGTAPTPTPSVTPTPAVPATLQPTLVSGLNGPTPLGYAPDGSVVASGTIAPTSTPGATASATGTSAPTGQASGSAAQAASDTATWVFTTGQAPRRLGDAATVLAFSPDGAHVVLAVAGPAGSGNTVVSEDADGGNVTHLVDTTDPVVGIAWTSATQIDVVTPHRVDSVEMNGHTQKRIDARQGDNFTAITPSARFVTAVGDGHSRVVDLSNGATTDLAGASLLTWSADGSTVAWLDSTGVAVTTPGHLNNPDTHVALPGDLGALSGLAISRHGAEIAAWDGSGGLRIIDVATAGTLATSDRVAALVFAPSADAVELIATGGDGAPGVWTSAVPAATAHATTSTPTGATTAVDAFVAAQIAGNADTLATLAPGTDTSRTPHGLSRSYIIDVSGDTAGTVVAHVRLIVDPGKGHAVTAFSDEELTLTAAAGGAYHVTTLTIGTLTDQPNGPHVVHVTSTHGGDVVTVAFDSDLDPTAAAKAIAIAVNGAAVPVTVTYDPTSRTATVTLTTSTHAKRTLTVATSLVDITGQPLAHAYSVVLS